MKYIFLTCTELSRFTDGQVITIKLEDTEETFLVQRALLCCASDYFITALEGRFKEGIENVVRLPGCDTETFKLFLYWIGYHQLPGIQRVQARIHARVGKAAGPLRETVVLWRRLSDAKTTERSDESAAFMLESFSRKRRSSATYLRKHRCRLNPSQSN